MLIQSVRRVQPGKRTLSIFAKPADSPESELWLEQGGVFTELGTMSGFHGNPLFQGIWPTSMSRQRVLVYRTAQNPEAA